MHFSAKKFFLIGFIVILLVGIPVSVYLVQQQQELRSRAEKSTNLSFIPESSNNDPIAKNVGDEIPLQVYIEPGTNIVSFVKLEILYDPDKLTIASDQAFDVNDAVFPTVLGGPVYTPPGKVVVSMSVGNDPTKAIQTKVRVGTLTLRALQNTPPDLTTDVTFGASTLVTSLGSEDQASENVLQGSVPAIIVIGSEEGSQPTITVPNRTPTPTSTQSDPDPDPDPDNPPTDTEPTTPVVTSSPTTNNTAPVCTALTTDTTSGASPVVVNFTANGTDNDDTISKATFNFGDGQVSDVTSGGGIGTNAVNVPLAHTYTTVGTFQATAILTDSNNGVSNTTNCTQTITVLESSAATATPTMAPSGAAEVLMGFGAVAAFLLVAGTLIFFML